jgi:hypothetical protein
MRDVEIPRTDGEPIHALSSYITILIEERNRLFKENIDLQRRIVALEAERALWISTLSKPA